MPCIFCLAVFMLLAGAVTTLVLDQLEAQLSSVASEPVVRSVDSASVAKFETSVEIPGSGLRRGRSVPVAVTVYKKHKRVRIQVMTHDLTRAEAEAIEDLIAAALGLQIVDRSDAHDEQKVREAFGENPVPVAKRASKPDQEIEDEDQAESESEAGAEDEPDAGRKAEHRRR
jgi:septal ring factor EnvC (AmiA/AmiB activator)